MRVIDTQEFESAMQELRSGRADLRSAQIGQDTMAETVAGWKIASAIIRLNKLGVDTSKL